MNTTLLQKDEKRYDSFIFPEFYVFLLSIAFNNL